MTKIGKKIIVNGFVQGVGFRYFAYQKAMIYNIEGYAKNLFDGKVEIIAIGNDLELESFIEQLKIGPSRSNVKSININDADLSVGYVGFNIY